MITKQDNELIFEDDESTISSIKIIRKEFMKKSIYSLIYIVIILAVYILYLIITYQSELFGNNSIINTISHSVFSKATIAWVLFSTTTFLIIYLIKLLSIKFTPSLISFIKKESTNIGFEFEKKYDSGLLFLLLNSISICILIYMDFGVIQFENPNISIMFQVIFSIYLILSLVIPVIWALLNDKYIIKLKENFFILFDFQFKIRSSKEEDSYLVGIHLTSNKLTSRFDKCGRIIYSRISQRRWLSRKKKSILNPYLYFHEFSTPINFQKQFLNMVLALNEWQVFYGSRVFCFDAQAPLNKIIQKDKFLDYHEFFSFNR
ncbi:MAG: hypothetical protein EU533_03425 [Promethearchaeota archaeon]|nr:MAG: hypothetical protein EU533_03425 [Candidatus Lokiarchaeota archaeon]